MREVLVIMVAGAMGSASRYGVSAFAHRMFGDRFAVGTLAVNLLGCLLLGFIIELGTGTELWSRTTQMALTVGFLGAFTTFSTFGHETVRFIESGSWGLAVLNVTANVVLGLLGATLGIILGRAIV